MNLVGIYLVTESSKIYGVKIKLRRRPPPHSITSGLIMPPSMMQQAIEWHYTKPKSLSKNKYLVPKFMLLMFLPTVITIGIILLIKRLLS